MQKQYTFRSLSNGDITNVTIESTNDDMQDYIIAEAEAVFNLCEEVEEVEI